MHSISMSGSAPPIHRGRRRRRSQTTIVIVMSLVSERARGAGEGTSCDRLPVDFSFSRHFRQIFPPNSPLSSRQIPNSPEHGGSPSVRSNWKAEDPLLSHIFFFLTLKRGPSFKLFFLWRDFLVSHDPAGAFFGIWGSIPPP